jgi:hypothetical protein
LAGNNSVIFSGFLFNPLDGNTYLSKMRQGWEGRWLFELTYSPERGKPVFLFPFYLFLGRISRIAHVSPLFLFHVARLIATVALFFALKHFFQWLLVDQWKIESALLWATFGGGLGWLMALFGGFTPDLWVAEGYVFLAAFANPHFPLSMALMVWMLTLSANELSRSSNRWGAFLAGIALANLSPFSWVITNMVLITYFALTRNLEDAFRRNKILNRVIFFSGGGFPFSLYQLWIVRQDWVLSEWNQQNVTPSPHLVSFLLGFFPLCIWSFFGAFRVLQRKEAKFFLPLIWIAISLILIYFPSQLQRRFMIGTYIPLVSLASILFGDYPSLQSLRVNSFKFWLTLCIGVSFLTNAVILIATFQAIYQRDRSIFIYREEMQAYRYLSEQTQRDAVVLAAPAGGIFIPAWTGLRVLYGHPFESIRSEERKKLIIRFYQRQMSAEEMRDFLENYSIKFILWGSREEEIANPEMFRYLKQSYPIAYHSEQITIFLVHQ